MRVSNDAASKAFLSGEVAGLCYKEIAEHAIAIAMSTGQTHATKLSLKNFSRGLTVTLVTDFVYHRCPLLLFLLIFLPVLSSSLQALSPPHSGVILF